MNMSKKSTKAPNNTEVIEKKTDSAVQTSDEQSMSTNRMNQFTDIAFAFGHGAINSIRVNASDYKAIDEDEGLSSVDKAVGKRKLLLWDVGIGSVTISSVLGLIWIAKKIIAA